MEYFFLLGSVKGNEMLPRRAQLKAQVEATVAEVRNSPRLAANRTPKRLGTNNSEPRLGLTLFIPASETTDFYRGVGGQRKREH